MRVLVLHAYSADNDGDGLLVDETLGLVRAAFGPGTAVTVVASRPESFAHVDATVVGSRPTWRGFGRDHRAVLRDAGAFDLVVGVGGGYLRAGRPVEAVKTALVHLPQLWVAARRAQATVYLPQSVGPLRWGLRRPVRSLMARLGTVMLRDDRSVAELPGVASSRMPDLALCSAPFERHLAADVDPVPVLSVRSTRGGVPAGVQDLAAAVGVFDGYVQSRVGANDDAAAMAGLAPRRVLDRGELMRADVGPRRVVVAMRLHAALLALRAGHLVVHLAYERKGFGAFADLGLTGHVHNAFALDPGHVRRQVADLLRSPAARDEYDATVQEHQLRASRRRPELVDALRTAVGAREVVP